VTEGDGCRGSEWYFLYFGFQAALSLLLSIVSEPNHPSAGVWREVIAQAITMFRQLGSLREVRASDGNRLHQLAMSYAQIMENVLNSTAPGAHDMGASDLAAFFQMEGPLSDSEFDFDRFW
jgi:transcriptional regulatory protein GAL4